MGLAHGGGIGIEGGSQRLLEETFLEADAEVAGEDFDEILRGDRRDGAKEGFEKRGFGGGPLGGAEAVEQEGDFGEIGICAAVAVGEDGFGSEARVVESARKRAVFGFGHAGSLQQSGADDGTAGLVRGGIRGGEGVTREPERGEAEFGFSQRAEVVGEDLGFGEFSCERGDPLGDGAEFEEIGIRFDGRLGWVGFDG